MDINDIEVRNNLPLEFFDEFYEYMTLEIIDLPSQKAAHYLTHDKIPKHTVKGEVWQTVFSEMKDTVIKRNSLLHYEMQIIEGRHIDYFKSVEPYSANDKYLRINDFYDVFKKNGKIIKRNESRLHHLRTDIKAEFETVISRHFNNNEKVF